MRVTLMSVFTENIYVQYRCINNTILTRENPTDLLWCAEFKSIAQARVNYTEVIMGF